LYLLLAEVSKLLTVLVGIAGSSPPRHLDGAAACLCPGSGCSKGRISPSRLRCGCAPSASRCCDLGTSLKQGDKLAKRKKKSNESGKAVRDCSCHILDSKV